MNILDYIKKINVTRDITRRRKLEILKSFWKKYNTKVWMRLGSFIFFNTNSYDVGLFTGFFKHPKMSQLRNQSHFFPLIFYRLSEFFHQTGDELFHHFLVVHAISFISPAEYSVKMDYYFFKKRKKSIWDAVLNKKIMLLKMWST